MMMVTISQRSITKKSILINTWIKSHSIALMGIVATGSIVTATSWRLRSLLRLLLRFGPFHESPCLLYQCYSERESGAYSFMSETWLSSRFINIRTTFRLGLIVDPQRLVAFHHHRSSPQFTRTLIGSTSNVDSQHEMLGRCQTESDWHALGKVQISLRIPEKTFLCDVLALVNHAKYFSSHARRQLNFMVPISHCEPVKLKPPSAAVAFLLLLWLTKRTIFHWSSLH